MAQADAGDYPQAFKDAKRATARFYFQRILPRTQAHLAALRSGPATLLDLFGWSPETFERNTRGSAIRRISWDQWRRNLAVALGNGSPSAAALGALREARAGASAMVCEHIDWAIKRLTRRSGGSEP